jgi:hypothetical protein
MLNLGGLSMRGRARALVVAGLLAALTGAAAINPASGTASDEAGAVSAAAAASDRANNVDASLPAWDSYWNYPFGTQQRVFPHSASGVLVSDQVACTASLVARDIVITAGHCVHPGSRPQIDAYYTNFRFCPAWHYGAASGLGCFQGRAVVTTGHWYNVGSTDGRMGADVGFVRLWGDGTGRMPGDIVGWLGMSFNASRDEVLNAQGFPGGPWGMNYQMMLHADYGGVGPQEPRDLTMTGGDWCQAAGASGSPLFVNLTSVGGPQWNVVTHVLSGTSDGACYWAHLGNEAQAAYEAIRP